MARYADVAPSCTVIKEELNVVLVPDCFVRKQWYFCNVGWVLIVFNNCKWGTVDTGF